MRIRDASFVKYIDVLTLAICLTLLMAAHAPAAAQERKDKSVKGQSADPVIVLPIVGKGTANYIPVFTGNYTIGNSLVSQTGNGLNVAGNVSAVSFIGSGSGLTNVPAVQLGGLPASAFAQTSASNTFTADQTINGNLNLSGYVNGTLSLQGNLIDSNQQQGANVLGGFLGTAASGGNTIAPGVIGGTIAGGGGIYDSSLVPTNPAFKQLTRGNKEARGSEARRRDTRGSSPSGGLTSGFNTVQADWGTIGGGLQNTTNGFASVVAGGVGNLASGAQATVSGGVANSASGDFSTVAGGNANIASGEYSNVSGGLVNVAGGNSATVPGGSLNIAAGDYSFAAGCGATANYTGSFVWNDSYCQLPAQDTAANQFVAAAAGGFYFYTSDEAASGSGAVLAAGSGSWSSLSDRNVKANFLSIDSHSLLEKIAAMPISTWNYKTQAESVRHLGPTAQDFRAAFGLGEDDKHISTVDAQGVALAGIQALYQTVTQLKQNLADRDREIDDLRARLADLEQAISAVATGKR